MSHPRNSLNASEKVSGISPCSTITVSELNTQACLISELPDTGPFSQGELQWVISLKGLQVLINLFLDSEIGTRVSVYACFKADLSQ